MASDSSDFLSNHQFIDGTHTFYRLRLATDPKAVVDQAKEHAYEDIATAYSELMQLNFRDMGYAALENLYSLANTEYYRGNIAVDQALLRDRHEALKLFGKSATQFTRAQAHAMQVSEALKPQPTSPTDLGLRPFGGGWADWETTIR